MGKSSGISYRAPITEKSITSLLRYFVLIPLVAPKGLEFILPGYKDLVTMWAMVVLAVILLDSIVRLHVGSRFMSLPIGLIVYYLVAIATSAFSSGGIVNGLQELFLYPAAFLYFLELDEDELQEYATASAYILCVLFVFQLVLSVSLFMGFYHLTFLGHVQVLSQYGLLSIMLSSFLYFKKRGPRFLPIILLLLGIACMLTADADSAHYSLIVFVAVLLLLKILPPLGRLDCRYIVLLGMAFSLLVVSFTITRRSPLIGTGFDWTFNGRLFVWESADSLIRQAPLFGYGVENSVISTFWSSGMSYAHNQAMQCLVDGGVILLVAMVWMLCSVAGCVNKIMDIKVRRVAMSIFCALLFVMVFDSFSPYSYSFILLAFIAREGLLAKERDHDGVQHY